LFGKPQKTPKKPEKGGNKTKTKKGNRVGEKQTWKPLGGTQRTAILGKKLGGRAAKTQRLGGQRKGPEEHK